MSTCKCAPRKLMCSQRGLLIYACTRDLPEVLSRIVHDPRADINAAVDGRGDTVLDMTQRLGHGECTRILLGAGARPAQGPSSPKGHIPRGVEVREGIWDLTVRGYFREAELLARHGKCPNRGQSAPIAKRTSALHLAAVMGQAALCAALLSAGADNNMLDERMLTPLGAVVKTYATATDPGDRFDGTIAVLFAHGTTLSTGLPSDINESDYPPYLLAIVRRLAVLGSASLAVLSLRAERQDAARGVASGRRIPRITNAPLEWLAAHMQTLDAKGIEEFLNNRGKLGSAATLADVVADVKRRERTRASK